MFLQKKIGPLFFSKERPLSLSAKEKKKSRQWEKKNGAGGKIPAVNPPPPFPSPSSLSLSLRLKPRSTPNLRTHAENRTHSTRGHRRQLSLLSSDEDAATSRVSVPQISRSIPGDRTTRWPPPPSPNSPVSFPSLSQPTASSRFHLLTDVWCRISPRSSSARPVVPATSGAGARAPPWRLTARPPPQTLLQSQYDPVFALGFVTVYDQLMEGYPSDEDREAIFKAYVEALNEDPVQYRADAQKVEEWARSQSATTLVDFASREGEVENVLKDISERAGSKGNFSYSRFFAVGLFRLLELSNATEPTILDKLCAALNIDKKSVDRDLDVYRNLLSKLVQAKELLREYVDREKKKIEERAATQKANEAVKKLVGGVPI